MNKGKGFQEKLARRIAKHEKQLQKLTSYYQDYINKHKQSIKQSPNSTDCCISENNDKTGNISKHNPVTCPDDMIASQDTALFLPTLQMFDNDDDDNQALTQIEDHDGHIENDSQLTGHDIDLVSNLQGNGMETVEDDSLLMLEAKATPSYKCDNNANINSDNSHALSTGKKRQQSVDTKIKSLNWTINSCTDVDDIEKSSTTLYEFQLQACLQVKEPVKSIAFSSNNGNCNDSIKIATCSDRIITIWTLSKDDFSEWNFVKCLTCDKNMEKFSDVNFLSTDTGICISVTGKFRASHNRIYRITDKEDFSLELRSGCSKFPCKCEYRSVNCPPGHKDVITAILNGNDKNYYFRKYCLDDKCQNLISCNDFEKPNILEKLSSIVVAHGSELMLLGLFEKTIVLWNWSNYQITKRIALDGSFIEKEAAKCFRVVIEKDWLFAVIGSSFDKNKDSDALMHNYCLLALNHKSNRIVKLQSYGFQECESTQRTDVALCCVSQTHIATVTRNNTIYLWNLYTSACLAEIPYQGQYITSIQLHPELHLFALATNSNCLHIYSKVKKDAQLNN